MDVLNDDRLDVFRPILDARMKAAADLTPLPAKALFHRVARLWTKEITGPNGRTFQRAAAELTLVSRRHSAAEMRSSSRSSEWSAASPP